MPTEIDQAPLSESTFYILLSLAPGPQHGYAMLKDVESLSGGRLRLSTGTLYGAIQRLLEQAWIEPVASEDTAAESEVVTAISSASARTSRAKAARAVSPRSTQYSHGAPFSSQSRRYAS